MIFFNEKKIEKESDIFWHRKVTLKVTNWHFSIAWFWKHVDLQKNYEKVLNSTQLGYQLMGSWWKILKWNHLLTTYIYPVFLSMVVSLMEKQDVYLIQHQISMDFSSKIDLLKCSSHQEKLLKFEVEGREFTKKIFTYSWG